MRTLSDMDFYVNFSKGFYEVIEIKTLKVFGAFSVKNEAYEYCKELND